MKMQREEQKIQTPYKTAKGRTENMTPCTLKKRKTITLCEKERTENMTLCYCKGKNRKLIPYVKMQREEQKIHTLYENAKGRTENMTPCTLKGKKKKKKRLRPKLL